MDWKNGKEQKYSTCQPKKYQQFYTVGNIYANTFSVFSVFHKGTCGACL
jgi:hypothetical protein